MGNPDGARFCNACGAALVPAPASVRKIVTVLFCDLVGSTALGDGADPEVLREQMGRYHAELRSILERHGGTVEKFIGDAVMAVFGLPATHEDDALRAIRAAAEIRRAVDALGFSVRIGINTSEVVAGEGESLVTGDAVNVAARFEQAAEGGEILIGELTYRLVRDATQTESVEPLNVKGKSAPLTAYRLLGVVDPGTDTSRRSAAPFVGRETELAALDRALGTAIEQRQPQLATIVGPPGIGKSRLVRELVARSSARVVAGRCLSYGQGITYWPLQEIAHQIGDIRAALGGIDEADLAAARIEAALGVAAATPDEIAWGFRRLFESLARDQPLVVAIDDIHWAEPTLLDLVEYLANFARDARLLLVCTARAELLETRPDWAAPRGNTTVLLLEPLLSGQVETLVEQLDELPGAERSRIIEAAEGNPLFVEQLVALRAEASGTNDQLEIPPTIQALLAARIDRLEPSERAVIERASVEGRLFHRGSVQQLVPQAIKPEVGRRLLSLVRRQFIRPDQAELPGDDGFRFDHVLIRDAAYDSLPKKLRAELHERFADWLQARLGESAPDEILGYHLEQAFRYRSELGLATNGVGEQGAEKLVRAARAASLRGDVRAQVNLLERAARLLPDEAPSRAAVLLGLGGALADNGESSRAIDVLRDAESRSQLTRDAHTAWLARLRLCVLEMTFEPEGAAQGLLSTGQSAIAALPNDHAVLARAWQVIGQAHSFSGRMQMQYSALQMALEHARAAGDDVLELEALTMTGGAIAFGPIPVAEGLRWVQNVMEQTSNRAAIEPFCGHLLGHLRARLGEFDAAREAITTWRGHLRELGQEDTYQLTAGCLWDVCALAENWTGGEQALREVEDSLARAGEKGYRSTVAAELAEVLFRQGRLDEAEAYSKLSEELGGSDDTLTQGGWRAARAKVLASRGQVEAALPMARAAVGIFAATDFLDAHAQALIDLASILRLAGDTVEADRALDEALALYTRRGNLVGIARAQALLADG